MLKRVRDEIDRLDSEIAALLMRRLEMASVAGRLKKDVLDQKREREVLAKDLEGYEVIIPKEGEKIEV